MPKLYPIIMSGGAGSRLWPLSRREHPKQFLALVEDMTMLQATAKRLNDAPSSIEVASPIVICGKGQEEMAQDQLCAIGMPASAIIIESEGRNTAAVAAVAAHHINALDPDGLVLLLSADHHVADPVGFWAGVEKGMPAANRGKLVTLGIEATHPDTGYGYICRGKELHEHVYEIDAFVEKPDYDTACRYLEQGGYYWNAGIFLFQASAMLREFSEHAPEIADICARALQAAEIDEINIRLAAEIFAECPSAPVDTTIMEPTQQSAVVAPVRAGWSDIGSWKALSEIRQRLSGEKNTTLGDVIEIGCSDCYVQADGQLVTAIGLKNIVIVADGETIMVVHKDHAQDVKRAVETLKNGGRSDLL